MRKFKTLKLAVAMTLVALGLTANAEIDLSYYSSLQGLCGSELKDAVHTLVTTDVSMLTYGSGSQKCTWAGFYDCDQLDGGIVLDRYSEEIFYFDSRGSSVTGMNIEHSFPKSWWGGTNNNAYKDLYNLMPCESKINSTKSNYPMGAVVSGDKGNGFTKVGKGEDDQWYWEPADQWKGDFARGYMYMATAYQDFTWVSTSPERALLILENDTYPTLQWETAKLYISWAKADPVTKDEVTRNDNVQKLQGNRNPFNDFPNLMEYIWGDSINVPFNVATTVKGGVDYADTNTGNTDGDTDNTDDNTDDNTNNGEDTGDNGDNGDNGETSDENGTAGGNENPGGEEVETITKELYTSTFLGDTGECTNEVAVQPTAPANVWTNSSKYGWTASAYSSSTCYESDASLVLPEVDLTEALGATLTFSHAANKFSSATPSDYLSVIIRDESGVETALEGISWPAGTNWIYVDNSDVSLDSFIGHKIQVLFRYTSTTSVAGTWEIKNLTISGTFKGETTHATVTVSDDTTIPTEYFSIDGRRVDPATFRGVVIRRQGPTVTKLILR